MYIDSHAHIEGKEFDADARAFFRRIAQIDDTAFLLLFCRRIRDYEFRPEFESCLEIEEATVRIDDDRLAAFAELAAFGVFPGRAHGNAREDAGTAPLVAGLYFGRFSHSKNIVQCVRAGVNGVKCLRFLKRSS